jgi:hypothetical protein
VQGVTVRIHGPDGKVLATITTDQDGWYVYTYKYTGKAATFTIELPAYVLSQSVTLKSNGYAVVNFTVPSST